MPSNFSSFKSKVNKLDIDKLKTTPVDLGKIYDVVKNEVVKITKYNELNKEAYAVHTTDTSDLIKKLTATQKLMKL